jgi:CRP-like cAMP-binding protein
MSTDTTVAQDAATTDDELARFVWTRHAGETIFAQGEFGAELFIVEAGEVELLTIDAGGLAHRRAVLTAGETFGERALLDEQARELTARALTDCRLIRLDFATLVELIREKPLIGVQLLRRQVRRVRWLDGDRAAERALASSEGESPSPAADPAVAPASDGAASMPAFHARHARFTHKESGRAFAVPDEGEAIVGRIDRATGLAPAIDFTELDRQRSLSRRHARIERASDGFQLREEPGVGNGTFVNDRRVAAGQVVSLRDGDRVRFGMVEMLFQLS